jgi:hypothetical protein
MIVRADLDRPVSGIYQDDLLTGPAGINLDVTFGKYDLPARARHANVECLFGDDGFGNGRG